MSANRRVIPLPPRKPAGFYGSIDDSLFRSIEDLRDVCLDGAECLYDPELHDGPADLVETFDQEAARVEVAKQVCATCPVLDACLAYALRVRPAFGVWAGRTTAELADLYDASGAAPVLGEIA